ncbi:MAG: outer membrane protein transport protein [Ignavibacteriales bacterium]|nr:outer membrane protein transport protein [Ignavibacteriales bacterium]
MKKVLLLFVVCSIFTSGVFAGGFQINEHGARAMAMGGAFTGLANDPSAIYFNPAGITQLSGTRISAGVTLISPISSFRGPAPDITEYSQHSQLFTPFNFYVTHQFTDDLFVGLGVNNPFGLGTEWDDTWPGRYLAVDTEVRTFFFNPVVAYKLTEELSISAGLNFAFGDVKIIRNADLAPFDGEAQVNLSGDATAWGFTAGIFYKVSDQFSAGVSFRSESTFDFEGTAETEAPSQFSALVPSGDISASLTTPMNLTAGVAYKPLEYLTITADFQYIGWSSYDVLAVDFKDESQEDLAAVRDYENTYILRLGGEYILTDALALRGGFLFDNNPVKDELVEPTLPDSDRLGFNIGFGYKLTDNINVDVAYLFLRFNEREITDSQINYTGGEAPFNGVYNSTAHLFGVNFSYNF